MRPVLPLLLCVALPVVAQEGAQEGAAPSPEEAIAVVIGRVEDVYARGEGQGKEQALRLRVTQVEKGRMRIGNRIYARCGAGLALPKAEEVRLYLGGSAEEGWTVVAAEDAAAAPSARVARGDTKQLHALVDELMEAAKAGDWKRFAASAKDLRLPDAEAWLTRLFGAEAGKLVAAEYAEISKSLIVEMRRTFSSILAEGGGPFDVVEATGYQATGLQRRARFAMNLDVPLYTIHFRRGGGDVWSFVWAGGGWRWLGKLQALPREPLVLSVQFSSNRVDLKRLGEFRVKVTMENASEETVLVPTRYDGRVVRLCGRGLEHLWASQLEPATPPAQAFAPLKPKERITLLDLPLDQVFQLNPAYRWDWEGHPVPPLSPVHRWRELGCEAAAVFYVAAEAGARTLTSKPARITVVGGE
ncbi:MAG: hypothetical protein AB7N76_01230 [Planctomycetota bacterium]